VRTIVRTCVALLACTLSASAQAWSKWHALGPLDHKPGSTEIATVYPVERQLRAMEPDEGGPDLEQGYAGKGTSVARWSALVGAAATSTDLDVGLIDFNTALTPIPEAKGGWNAAAVAYLYRQVIADREMRVPISLGSDDGVRIWFNGQLVLDRNVARAVSVGDDQLTLHLAEGVNHLLVKVSQGGGGWGFRISPRSQIPQKAIDAAIDKGVARLLDTQLIDGSWGKRPEYGGGARCLHGLHAAQVRPAGGAPGGASRARLRCGASGAAHVHRLLRDPRARYAASAGGHGAAGGSRR